VYAKGTGRRCVSGGGGGGGGWRASVLAAASGNTTRRMTLPAKTETEMRSVGMLRYEAMLARTVSRSIAVIDSDDVGNVIQIVEYVMIASAAGMGVDVDMGVGVGAAEHSETCTRRTHNGRRGSGEGVGVGTGASAALAALQAHLAVAYVCAPYAHLTFIRSRWCGR